MSIYNEHVAAIRALAEQQRIANLIALWRVGQGGVEDESAEALTTSRGMGFGGKTLRPEIAEALGIKEASEASNE